MSSYAITQSGGNNERTDYCRHLWSTHTTALKPCVVQLSRDNVLDPSIIQCAQSCWQTTRGETARWQFLKGVRDKQRGQREGVAIGAKPSGTTGGDMSNGSGTGCHASAVISWFCEILA